ncbi:MAG TPA: hypothetical protein VGF61_13915 [Candidatus Acidoferrum sp.]|jgi:hypothetical protein
MNQQAALICQGKKTPRAAAIAGVIFSMFEMVLAILLLLGSAAY